MSAPRVRDQRPCDNCRRRRIRCLFASDVALNCVLCESRSTECSYVQDPPRKKRARESSHGETPAAVAGQPIRNIRTSRDPGPVLRDYTGLKGQSLLKNTLGHQNRQSSSVIGSTTEFDPSIVASLLFNPQGECQRLKGLLPLRRANETVHFAMRPDTEEEIEKELQNLDAIEKVVSPHGPELVNLYYRIVHPSFPILHKKVFLEKYGRTYRELTPIGLGAVYIMALDWWSYSPILSTLPKPNVESLVKMVLSMFFEVHRRPKISDLQGALVLLQRPDVNSWAITGHLVAMTQNLGINLDCSDWNVPDWERGVRKRVAWAVYMQDKWGCLVHGRGSHIKDDDWDVRPLESSDFPETSVDDDDEEGSAEIEKGKQTFLHMVSLTQILTEILDQFYTLKAIRNTQNTIGVLEKAKPIQLKLKAWFASLPKSMSMEDITSRKLSSVGYLYLAYYTTEITLHRAILRSHSTSPSLEQTIYLITREAARERFSSALEFVKRLRPEHLQSFWYFSSSLSLSIIGTFACILIATSRDRVERDACSAQLSEYRWNLRVSSNGAECMKHAVTALDLSVQIMDQQLNWAASSSTTPLPTPDAFHSTGNSEPVLSGGYELTSVEVDDWIQHQNFDQQSLEYSLDLDTLAAYDISHGIVSYDGAAL